MTNYWAIYSLTFASANKKGKKERQNKKKRALKRREKFSTIEWRYIIGEDFNLDLLFYHRKLKRLIAVEMKLGKFQAKYKGQLYLRWLDRYEKQDGEETFFYFGFKSDAIVLSD